MISNVEPTTEEIQFLMEAGFLYRSAGRLQEARDVFSGVAQLLPNSEVPDVALGTVLFAEGDFDGSIKAYKQALSKNPTSAYAYAHYGESLILKKEKERARERLNKAIELDPSGAFGEMARSLLELT